MDDAAKPSEPTGYGILTDAGVARLRQRIGLFVKPPFLPHNYEVTWDGVRHFANGFGDGNPLWCDPEYAAKTRWGGLIAPPTFIYTMGEPVAPNHTPEEKEILKGDPLIGLGAYQAVMDFEWWRPLKPGDRSRLQRVLLGVKVRDNSDFSGRTVFETRGLIHRSPDGELRALQRGTWIRAERHASAERKKQYNLPEPYTPEQLEAIDAAYAAETLRGAEPRYWEDVVVGETLPPIVRGPMRVSDLIVWHIGWGMQLTPPGAFGESYKVRRKVPGLFTPNALNVPDTVQRLHWDTSWANQLGIPLPYDYGAMRETFLANIVTNWMGDDGWLWKLSCQHRKFVYMGDTYWVKGSVADKAVVDGRHEVHLELKVENQWGDVTSPGTAVVLLPTRDQAVILPDPPASSSEDLVRHEVARLAAEA